MIQLFSKNCYKHFLVQFLTNIYTGCAEKKERHFKDINKIANNLAHPVYN